MTLMKNAAQIRADIEKQKEALRQAEAQQEAVSRLEKAKAVIACLTDNNTIGELRAAERHVETCEQALCIVGLHVPTREKPKDCMNCALADNRGSCPHYLSHCSRCGKSL